jgi:periplasmic divalent cation tolerance protein
MIVGLGLAGFGQSPLFASGALGPQEKSMERAVIVYTTYPSIVEAEQAGQALVERRLCACVNILPGMVSYYWWQGAIERADEVVMIIKARAGLAEPVRAAVKDMHSYTTPAVLVIPIETVDPDYHGWIVGEARGRRGAKAPASCEGA